MKRIISALLILCICTLFVFTGCTKKEYQPAITYGERTISVNMYNYLLAQAKTMALYTLGQTADSADFWDTDTGKMMADYITEDAITTAMSVVYFANRADENGVTLTSEESEKIETDLQSLMTSYGTDKKGFESIMASYGVNYDILKDYYILQKLAEKGKPFVLGENGSHPITEQDYKDYYEANYVTLRHINLNNINKLGANGKEVILTDEEKAAVEAQATEIELGLASGQDLSAFAGLSSDAFLATYPAGITIPTTSELYTLAYAAEQEGVFNAFGLYYYLLNNVAGFADAALSAENGTVKRVNTEKGIFFIQKNAPEADMYELYRDIMKESKTLEPQKVRDLMKELEGEFIIDREVLDTFSVKGTAMIALPASSAQ